MSSDDFTRRVYRCVRDIPHGNVLSYGDVAARLGTPRAARGVGWALAALPDGTDVPWWRVVNRFGAISIRAPHHAGPIQRALLEAEGVKFGRDGTIDMRRFRWVPVDAADEDGADD
jgi:methylated-DNA-protein-cysteine methyltransferase related protein